MLFSVPLQKMNELSHHIICLLAENDCVILPGIGGFIARYESASYTSNDEEFLSPQRVIGFNSALTMNDGLIVQSYMIKFGLNYPDASKLVDKDIEKLLEEINRNGNVHIEGLGMLVKQAQGAYSFEVSSSRIITPELYGLTDFAVACKKEKTHATEIVPPFVPQSESEEKEAPLDEEPKTYSISVKRSAVHKIAAIAAAIIVSFLLTTPAGNVDKHDIQTSAMIGVLDFPSNTEKTAAPKVEKVQKTNEGAEEVKTKPAGKVSVVVKPYTIVLASAVSERNAEEFIESLNKQGYPHAEIYKTSSMRRVIYNHFETEQEARKALKKLNDKDFAAEAWVLKTKI